jgi:Uma2 family endonuclease
MSSPRTVPSVLADIARHPVTLEEYFTLPETNQRVELVDGWVVPLGSSTIQHQRVVGQIVMLLYAACPPRFEAVLSPVDWIVRRDPHPLVLQPDIMVVHSIDTVGPKLTMPPVLAVEVLSPSNPERDAVWKRGVYAEAGVAHYWLADPNTGEVAVLHLDGDAYVETTRATAGIATTLTEPFALTIEPSALVARR